MEPSHRSARPWLTRNLIILTLVSLTLIVVAVFVFWGALEWIRQRLIVRLSLRIDWDVGPDVFDASFRSHALRKNVDVHQLLGDLMDLRQFLTGAPLLAIIQAPFAIVFIVIGWMFHPYLAILAAVGSVLILVFTYLTLKVSGPIMREAQQAKSQANRVAADSLRHAETTLAMGMLGAVRDRWYGQHSQFLTKQVYASEASGLMGGITGFITRAMPSLQIGLGVYLAMEGLITGGMVIVASMLVSKAMGPMNALLSNWRSIATARQAYDHVNALLMEDEVYQSQMNLPLPKGELVVSDLVAVPPGGKKPVLNGITLDRLADRLGQVGHLHGVGRGGVGTGTAFDEVVARTADQQVGAGHEPDGRVHGHLEHTLVGVAGEQHRRGTAGELDREQGTVFKPGRMQGIHRARRQKRGDCTLFGQRRCQGSVARMVDAIGHRFTYQEWMTRDIADALSRLATQAAADAFNRSGHGTRVRRWLERPYGSVRWRADRDDRSCCSKARWSTA